jgi:prepilin-type N-terminal cleavage/methylation domain-containing protein
MRRQRLLLARSASPRGFTLLEALIASSIFLIVLYAVYLVYDTSEANYARGSRKWDVQSQARLALERMAREMRTAGYDTPTKVANPMLIATNDTVSFAANTSGSTGGLRYITYGLRTCSSSTKGTILYRNESVTSGTPTYCGGDVLIDSVDSLTFTYYELNNVILPSSMISTPASTYQLDSQGSVTGSTAPSAVAAGSDRSKVRQVKISMTIRQQVGTVTVPFTVTTDVTLRNLIP